jgi:predicted DNA-binding transcriptional regulator AlpA
MFRLVPVKGYCAGVELVGLKEIAEMLQVSKQRAGQLAARADFPEPLGEISAGRVWKRSEVEEWARAVGRL